MQDVRCTYDPVGNLTHREDRAQQAVFFANGRVALDATYAYDPLYRLVAATGREHLGLVAPVPHSHDDAARVGLPHPGDAAALGRYEERYRYDDGGNLTAMEHRGTTPVNPGWSRTFDHRAPSQL